MASFGVDVLMKVDGGKALIKSLKKMEPAFLRELAAALPAEAENLLALSDAQAPRGTGTLVASSSVTSEIQQSTGRVRVAAAYLDEKAAAVHEGIHYGRHLEGTKGFKWYERTLSSFEGGFVGRVAQRLKRLVGGGS